MNYLVLTVYLHISETELCYCTRHWWGDTSNPVLQVWTPHSQGEKDTEVLQHVHRRGRELTEGLEHKSEEEQLRKLFSLEKLRHKEKFIIHYNQELHQRGCSRWGSVSSPMQQVTGQQETASSCTRGGLDWIVGTNFVTERKGCQALPQAAKSSWFFPS